MKKRSKAISNAFKEAYGGSKATMDIKEVLELTPEKLAYEQHIKLKAHGIEILKNILELIKKERYEDILEIYTRCSPSGDGYGLDNTFINFNFSDDVNGDDIEALINKLKSLKDSSKE